MRYLRIGLLIFLFAVSYGLAATTATPSTKAQPAQEPTPTGKDSTCSSTWSNGATTYEMNMCGASDITVKFRPYCPVCPGGVHVVYILPKLAPEADWMKDSAARSLDELKNIPGLKPWMGVVNYDKNGAVTAEQMTQDFQTIETAFRNSARGEDSQADHQGAAQQAIKLLHDAERTHGVEGADPCEIVVFYTYNRSDDAAGVTEQRSAAQTLGGQRTLMVGCPAVNLLGPPRMGGRPSRTPRPPTSIKACTNEPNLANPSQYFTKPQNVNEMAGFMNREVSKMSDDSGSFLDMSMVQRIPPGLKYSSSSTPPTSIDMATDGTGDTLLKWTWPRDAIKMLAVYTVAYRVVPNTTGTFDVRGSLEYQDSHSKQGVSDMPSLSMTVNTDPCGPTFTPAPDTATPVPPTDTPVPTATHTPVPTSTPTLVPTATVTPTPTPRALYIPLALRESCKELWVYSDVALVLDISGSMSGPSNVGSTRTKLQAAQDAARTFLEKMDLTPNEADQHDQVAVIGFNNTAWVQQPLTSDKAAIEQALVDLAKGQAAETRMDLAFERALEVLKSDKQKPGNTSVIILLTDGQPSGVPLAADGTMETTVIQAANAAKAKGVRIFTIAIGAEKDVNPTLLKACANDATQYFYTPDADELARIYTEIAYSFGCPKWRFWGGR